MRKGLFPILSAGILAFGIHAGEGTFRKVNLVNGDFSVPSETGVVNWSLQNQVYPGEYVVKKDADGKDYLCITPLENTYKSHKSVRTVVYNTTAFKASAGDTVRFSCNVRGNEKSQVGFVLSGGPRHVNQWILWRMTPGKNWTEVKKEYKIKAHENVPDPASYRVGFDVDGGSVDVRDISIAVLRK